MAGSVNKVILVGHVGADPEIRSTQGGSQIANLRLATSESWKDKRSGERKEKTEWHTVVIFNEHLVEVVDKYVKKGSKLYIEGQLQTRKWEDRDGNDRYSTEVVVAAFKGEIQMLSSTRDGNEDGDEDRGSSRRGGSSRSSRSDDNDRGSSRRGGGSDRSDRSDRGGSRSGGGSNNSSSDDFDDEIPF